MEFVDILGHFGVFLFLAGPLGSQIQVTWLHAYESSVANFQGVLHTLCSFGQGEQENSPKPAKEGSQIAAQVSSALTMQGWL